MGAKALTRSCALVVVCGCLVAPAASARLDPKQQQVASDMKLASSLLVSTVQLGSGWAASGTASGELGCDTAVEPREADLTETGWATSRLFVQGRFRALSQTIGVLISPTQAATAWKRMTGKSLLICMEQQLEGSSTMGAPVSVTDWLPLRAPANVSRSVGYRVAADAVTGSKRHTKIFFDVFVLQSGRATTRIALTALNVPYPAVAESRVVDTIAKSLAGAAGSR